MYVPVNLHSTRLYSLHVYCTHCLPTNNEIALLKTAGKAENVNQAFTMARNSNGQKCGEYVAQNPRQPA